MSFHPNQQLRLVQSLSPLDMFASSFAKPAPWDSVIDFMTHRDFCGRRLYPRQRTLYKLVFLEIENMTDYDLEVIEEWRQGFIRRRDTFGIQPDVFCGYIEKQSPNGGCCRVHYLKHHGYRRFPHIQLVLGRRGSKGLLGGGLGAEQIAYFYSLDDWQAHYDIDPGQNGVLSVVATSQSQAQRFQFADIRRTVERCKYLQPHIASSKDHFLSVRTPADIRHIAEMKARRVPIEHEIATLTAVALSSSSSAGRGGVGFANYYDEMAHLVLGTGSVKSGEEIYNAWQPSLDQFGKDGLTFIPSSPFCLEPSTRVLTEDLRWVPVGSLMVGDKVVGFDENLPGGSGRGRCWRQAEVTETSVIHAPRYKITMESGKELVSTSEHMWLGRRSQLDYRWIKTSMLKPGDKIKSIGVEPWGTDESREAGYLAGFFDGEGYLSGRVNSIIALGYTQNNGVVNDYVKDLLIKKGFTAKDYGPGQKLARMRIQGGMGEVMRFLGQIRPERLLPKFHERFYGGRIYGSAGPAVDRVVSVEYLDEGEVIALGTSTNTLVAEGLLSHNTKIGIFYKLYQDGSVLLPDYNGELRLHTEKTLKIDAEEEIVEATAEPEYLILQLPSWGLYLDYERGPELIGVKFRRPVTYSPDGPLPENARMRRMEQRNPDKFRVERRAQFAEVEGAYLDPLAVEAMFKPPGWRPELEAQARGYLTHSYRIHCDPSRTGANFALAIGHNEIAPCDVCGSPPSQGLTFHPCQACTEAKRGGMHWPHVIFDLLHVWRPGDFPPDEEGRRQIDYIKVMSDLDGILTRFPSTKKLTFDQYDSALGIAQLRRKFSPRIQVGEVIFAEKENQRRAEKFKSALNLGWMHGYNDGLYEDGGSLLEMEMKFLAERNGKVIKQDFGPVTTKDLFDAVAVVATDLLRDALERHQSGLSTPSFGSSDSAGLRAGREFVRANTSLGARIAERLESVENPARSMIANNRAQRARQGSYQPSRANSIRARAQVPRAGRRRI